MKVSAGLNSKRIKVLLAVPHYVDRISRVAQTTVGPPLGLAYLAAVCEQRVIDVSVLDANALTLSDPETVERIAGEKPDVVGLTAVTPTVDQCGRLAEGIRSRLPSCLIAMGGVHPTAVPERTLERFPAVDLIVRGEADTRFADLMEGLMEGKALSDFKGLTFREEGGEVMSTPSSSDLEDVDTLPFPSRHLLPMERYIGPDGDRFTTIVGTRGCPNRCVYCSVNQVFGRRLRNRNPESVAQEMADCHNRFQTKVFGFNDDTFTTNSEWVRGLCDAIVSADLHRRIRWLCLTRVDRVDPELLSAMRSAGCFKVEFGIESGDQNVLDSLGKGTTPEHVLNAFRWARQAGLKTLAFVMLFSPAETQKSLDATKKLVFRADPDLLQASFCTPYPGTQLAAECEKKGIALSDDWSQYVFLTGPVMDHPRFSRDRMLAWQKHLLRSFYLRPRIMLRLVVSAFQGGAWRGFIRTAIIAFRSLWKS